MDFRETLKRALEHKEITDRVYANCLSLYESYSHSMHTSGFKMERFDPLFESLLLMLKQQVSSPYHFEPYHQKIISPFDYYKFGLEFFRPLVDKNKSSVGAIENIAAIEKQITAGENVILFANHQTEVDPQLMSLALEDSYSALGAEVIFVAGDRVLSDPMAIPFSMGRNLLCIYSKRHIDNPPEKKEEKLQHNQRTMQRMKELLSEGGKFIYVAPSGGRDRPDEEGSVVVARFDPQSIEMFRLMAKGSSKPVHFYPLALATFDILPPPKAIETELGETRNAKREGISFFFGKEIDMETIPGSELSDRHERRAARADYIWNLVKANYEELKKP